MNREDTLNPFSDPSNSRESAFPLFFFMQMYFHRILVKEKSFIYSSSIPNSNQWWRMVWTNVRFPEQTMILLTKNIKDFSGLGISIVHSRSSYKNIGPYAFRVAPSMTKLEAKEYLEKIYNVKVEKIHSVNFLGMSHLLTLPWAYFGSLFSYPSWSIGKLVRTPGRKIYREPNYKKMFVYLADPNKTASEESSEQSSKHTLSYEGIHKEKSQEIVNKRLHNNAHMK